MASAENSQQAQPDTDAQTQLTVPSESQQTQQGMDRLAQQPGTGLTLDAQPGLPAGGLLTKPKPVGIGHMCRAISALTGGISASPSPPPVHAGTCFISPAAPNFWVSERQLDCRDMFD